jgi:hypothetical protein
MMVLSKIDCLLYNLFGYVSPTRKKIWKEQREKIQSALNAEHEVAERLNERYGTVYTTKQALEQ